MPVRKPMSISAAVQGLLQAVEPYRGVRDGKGNARLGLLVASHEPCPFAAREVFRP